MSSSGAADFGGGGDKKERFFPEGRQRDIQRRERESEVFASAGDRRAEGDRRKRRGKRHEMLLARNNCFD